MRACPVALTVAGIPPTLETPFPGEPVHASIIEFSTLNPVAAAVWVSWYSIASLHQIVVKVASVVPAACDPCAILIISL